MIEAARYAIYYMPATTSPLWTFGCRVLGYDAATASDVAHPYDALAAVATPRAFIEPSVYGFHATLKAPFSLVDGATEDTLVAAAIDYAAGERSFDIGHLQVAPLQRFVALTPFRRSDPLHRLADDCVRAFEPFRAPLTAADQARRLAAPLSPAQAAHLDHWGYPYVFEQFQFHMTLSGPLAPEVIGTLQKVLAELYAPIDTNLTIDGLAVFKQDKRTERFRVLTRIVFGLI